jgi:uncharacterized membrane protein
MLRYPITYVTTFLSFGIIDAGWIALVVAPLYKQTLGDILLDNFRGVPAIAFYALQILGIMVFVVPRTAGGQNVWQNFLFGALFGLFTYACFDLTNYALLRAWTLKLTVSDIVWGTFVTGVASAVGIYIADVILRKLS